MFSSAPDNHELKGSLQSHPLVELLREFTEAKLSGSFRLSHEECKAIVYLRNGEVVFAVSNQRQHRLFELLLQSYKIVKEIFSEIPNFTNDFALGEALVDKKIVSQEDIDAAFSYQIKLILKTALNWETGEWIFSPLAKIKENIHFEIDYLSLMMDHARSLSSSTIIRRFKSFEENFGVNRINPPSINLYPHEAYVLSRFQDSLMRIRDINDGGGLSDAETMKDLYILWLGNFLIRKNWNSLLTEHKIRLILSAKISLKETAPSVINKPVIIETPEPSKNEVSTTKEVIKPVVISDKQLEEEYLKRIEKAESYYEMLEIPIKASLAEIKTAYFKLAKNYHPDKYHQQTNTDIQQRIQSAFTEIARAYETLKDDNKRETYDFKLRKYLETMPAKAAVTDSATVENSKPITNLDKAGEEFEQGFNYLMNEEYLQAIPYLYRAVQMSPDNAKYHAYYGKSLSSDDKQRHKAETEVQTAIKLDPNNTTFRIMLVELFIQFGLLRRAEGELQRFLNQFPNNREAQVLLESLPKKS